MNKFSKLIIGVVVIANILFTIGVLYIFLKIGTEPTGLIVAWFGFTTGELWMLASIKKKQIDKENNNDKLETKTYV